MSTSDQKPIFIVGPSRSGTTLMGGCLNSSPDVFITRETHFFDDLATRMSGGLLDPLAEHERRECEDYFLALTHRLYGQAGDPERGSMDRSEFHAYSSRLGSSPASHFEAFCRMQAEERNRIRWGEKTPRHVFRIAEILSLYPNARVVCMIRDPRAVVASYRDFKKGPVEEIEGDAGSREALEKEQLRVQMSYHVVIASLMWRAVARAASQALARFGAQRVWIQKYEDLALSPESSLRALCDWLSIGYSPAMIDDVPTGTTSYGKFESGTGVNVAAVGRWRERMSPSEIYAVQICCRAAMAEFGYEPIETHASPIAVVRTFLSLPTALLSAFRANRSRSGGAVAYVLRRLRAMVS